MAMSSQAKCKDIFEFLSVLIDACLLEVKNTYRGNASGTLAKYHAKLMWNKMKDQKAVMIDNSPGHLPVWGSKEEITIDNVCL